MHKQKWGSLSSVCDVCHCVVNLSAMPPTLCAVYYCVMTHSCFVTYNPNCFFFYFKSPHTINEIGDCMSGCLFLETLLSSSDLCGLWIFDSIRCTDRAVRKDPKMRPKWKAMEQCLPIPSSGTHRESVFVGCLEGISEGAKMCADCGWSRTGLGNAAIEGWWHGCGSPPVSAQLQYEIGSLFFFFLLFIYSLKISNRASDRFGSRSGLCNMMANFIVADHW